MLKERFITLENNGIKEYIELKKYYINFCGKFIGTILASNKEKATVRAQSYFLGKEIEIENRWIEVDEIMVKYIITMTELEYKEFMLPIKDILELL